MGRSSGVPRTSPRQIVKIATTVSIEMSSGSEATAAADELGDVIEDRDDVLGRCVLGMWWFLVRVLQVFAAT